MKKADSYLAATLLGLLLFAVSLLDAQRIRQAESVRLERMGESVALLELTDLALFTEARYTRHITQADRHAAFQDHPMALEHFPSGSLILPPTLSGTPQ
jgi:hypothetical protein